MVEYINTVRKEDALASGAEFPSDEFAELRHRDFTAKVPKVLGEEMSEKFRTSLKDAYGRNQPGYVFPKREACLMAMSYRLKSLLLFKSAKLAGCLQMPG